MTQPLLQPSARSESVLPPRTRIQRVVSDNAWSYHHRQEFAAAVAAIGARQKFIKPLCRWQNGKVERLNRTLATEWA